MINVLYSFGLPFLRALQAAYLLTRAQVAFAPHEQRCPSGRGVDQWVKDGCNATSPVLTQEEAELRKSYIALRAAVGPS